MSASITVSKLQRLQGREGYYVRIYNPQTARRTWRKMGETRQQALRNRRRLLIELAEGRFGRESVTLTKAIAAFRRLRDRRLREKTRRLHASHYARWKRLWGRRPVDRITAREVERHFAERERAGWSGSTLNRERTLLRAFFAYCRERGWVAEDPTRTIRRYKDVPAKPTVVLSDEQCAALLRACREPSQIAVVGRRNSGGRAGGKTTGERRWTQTYRPPAWLYPLVLAGLRTLLRLGNLLELRWRHVDVRGRVIRLPARETKGGTAIEIPIGDDLLAVLGPPQHPEGRVFATAPRDNRAVARAFDRAVRRAGIPRCTFHDLRKTGATQMLRAGVPLHVVQAIGGWRRPDVLLRHYTQASLEDKREATKVLERVAST